MSLPEGFEARVLDNFLIAGDDSEFVDQGGGDNEAIEGVFVDGRQRGGLESDGGVHRDFLE